MSDKPRTLVQTIFSNKTGVPVEVNAIYDIDVDVLMGHDGTATLGIAQFEKEKATPWNPANVLLVGDHFSPPATIERAEIQNKMIRWAEAHGFPLAIQEGICHQLLLEHPGVLPGGIVIGADSHTVTSGAVGAFATGVGTTDFLQVLRTGKIWLKVPPAFKFVFKGTMPDHLLGKDLALEILRLLGNDGAIYKSLEFFDETENGISMAGRATLSNMSVEAGAKCGIFCPDAAAYDYVEAKLGKPVERVDYTGVGGYEKEFVINCHSLKPLVAAPHDPGNVKTVKEVEGTAVTQVFIGSCTAGRLEDLQVTARVFAGKKIAPYVKVIVIPGSQKVFLEAMEKGYISTIAGAGALIGNPSCGPCCNIDKGLIGEGEVCLSTSNRNFRGRMGSLDSEVYLASTLTAAVSALTGKITDPTDHI